ncbi:DUF4136 domain-containing protein [Sphingomonas sp. SM33]|uniref:DUF4136 domain-containing protein n=1 Tax=Sphingomonas telluris TaxID=2907998 RepID=A0ABS9VMX1_9SPHN|nr:DUF4136 domain-containing protein [Sphingomonas telluris]MCH8615767.1 DUF4136 domain-containing protein [Sphingomonas telluris]
MHSKSTLLVAFAAGVIFSPAAAVAGPQVSAQSAPGVNFSAYKTYSWVQANVQAGGNPIIQQQIMNDIDTALAGKGYQKTPANGDMSLILTLGAREKTDVESWGRFGLQTSVYQYTQGQLSLDAFDTKTQQAVWHGQASETINPDKPNQSKVDSAIQKFMTSFPATAAPAAAAPNQ